MTSKGSGEDSRPVDEGFYLDLSGPQRDLGLALQRQLDLVSTGLTVAPTLEVPSIKMPQSAFHFMAAKGVRPTVEEIREEFAAWILAAGFRESIEAFQQFLDALYSVNAAQDFLGSAPRSRTEIAQWIDGWLPSEAQFHKLGLHGKLEILERQSKLILSEDYRSSILSLQATRNCLVHRRGFVSEQDIRGMTHLIAKWRRPRFLISGPDGTRETGLPVETKEGERVQMVFPVRGKEFPLGSRVQFTGTEFAEICFTLSSIASILTERLVSPGGSKP